MAIISNFLELKKLFSCKSTLTNDQNVIRVLETIAVWVVKEKQTTSTPRKVHYGSLWMHCWTKR